LKSNEGGCGGLVFVFLCRAKLQPNAKEAIEMIDHGLCDDKLICSYFPISPWKQRLILLYFMIYAKDKSATRHGRTKQL